VEIKGKNIIELQRLIDAGSLTSYQLTLEYIKRITQFDFRGPQLNSICEMNPDALEIAASLDRERKIKGPRGLLHGMPILIKGNISTNDKMRTNAGSVALNDNFARHDAVVVSRLRAAGAVILGKTNLTEFAHYMSSSMKNGYSSAGGQVLNPYGSSFDVSGSSSGSAVAVACDFCAASVGTETAGSIICPSSNNNICGIKPTVGLVSRSGIIPICGQDSAGPMGRTIADCAIMLNEMVTPNDYSDPSTFFAKVSSEDYTHNLVPDSLRGMRIGVNRIRCEADIFPADIEDIFEHELDKIQDAGAVLIDSDINYTGLENNILSQSTLLYEFKSALEKYISQYSSGSCRTLYDIVQYNNHHPKSALKYGQDILEDALNSTSGKLIETAYWDMKIKAIEDGAANGILKVIKDNNLDVIACAGYSNLPPITGFPAVSVPMGFSSSGLPVGMSFFAGPYQESTLIKVAFGYEQITNHHKNPFLAP